MFKLSTQHTKLMLELLELAKEPQVKAFLKTHEKELSQIVFSQNKAYQAEQIVAALNNLIENDKRLRHFEHTY